MKRFYRIATVLAVTVLAASCSDYLETDRDLIRFTASSGVGTKASYSGQQIDGRERVDWTSGDVIQIFCYQSITPETHQCDYVVSGTISPSGYYSTGSLERRAGDIGLRWGEEGVTHTFFAISPANYANSSVTFRYFADNGTATYQATIPSSQPPVSVSADNNGNYTAAPNMKHLIMVSQASAVPEDRTVVMDFKPVVTAVDFTIMNGYNDQSNMALSKIRLSSTSSALSGIFVSEFGSTSTTYSSTGNSVEIPFSSPASVAYGKTLKFTLFMLGDENPSATDIDNLTIELITDDDTSIQSVLKTTAGNMTFPRSKKSYVTGLIVPGACVWTISAEPDAVTAWNESSSSIDIGPAQELPVSGPFGGLYLSKGYLKETAADTYKLTGNDQLEIIKYYGEDLSSTPNYYHSCDEDLTAINIDGFTVPTSVQWNTIIGYDNSRIGATVNGAEGKHYLLVIVDLVGSSYESYGLPGSSGVSGVIKGMLLFPDGANITLSELTDDQLMDTLQNTFTPTIAYDRLMELCNEANGCAFLPCAGHVLDLESDVQWETGGDMGWYVSTSANNSNSPYACMFSQGIGTTAYPATGYVCPARMVKE